MDSVIDTHAHLGLEVGGLDGRRNCRRGSGRVLEMPGYDARDGLGHAGWIAQLAAAKAGMQRVAAGAGEEEILSPLCCDSFPQVPRCFCRLVAFLTQPAEPCWSRSRD